MPSTGLIALVSVIWHRRDFSTRQKYLECLLRLCKSLGVADLNDIAVFVRVAQFESFSRAAHSARHARLSINELCTNASKHGALTVPNGRVNIATELNEHDGTFHFKWSEREGLSLESRRAEASGCSSSKKASRSNLGPLGAFARQCDSAVVAQSTRTAQVSSRSGGRRTGRQVEEERNQAPR
jgi:hypothetical protein